MKRGKVERRHNNKLVNGRDIKTINLKCLRYRENIYIYIYQNAETMQSRTGEY